MRKQKAKHSAEVRSQIRRLKTRLDDLYTRADPRSFDDQEIASDLAGYLCVRVSGYLEQATSIIMRGHCEKNSWGNVQQFAMSWLERAPNLSSDALLKLVGRFNAEAAGELEELLSLEERKSSLNALIGLRNDIAHGRQQGLSRQQVWEYLELVEFIVDWLLEKFDPIVSGDNDNKS